MKSTFVSVGEVHVKHVEGDVWEERGKLWTIKNGIKKTVTKMDNMRKEFNVPLACPTCKSPMNHHLDEKMWAIHKTCFNCVIDMEHKIRVAGKWEEYERQKLTANADSFLKDLKDYFNELYTESDAKAQVTEDGMIEKWKDVSSDRMKEIGSNVIDGVTDKIKKYKNK